MTMRGQWSAENALNRIGGLVLAVVGVLAVYEQGQQGGQWLAVLLMPGLLFLVHLGLFIAFVSNWAANRRARQLGIFWLQAISTVVLYLQLEAGFIAILGIVWIVQATELFELRRTVWLLLAIVAVFTATQFHHYADAMTAATNGLTLGLFHLFAMVATYRFRREQELREETAALNRELMATRELLSQHSRQAERLRIARDLHDLLGHHMTALILQLEVATHVCEGKGREKVEQALALGKLLLGDLRSAVSELRDDDAINLQQSVEKLVQELPDLEVSLDFANAPVVKDVDVAETLLRCVQEALTNILRHSNASHCRISLTEYYNQFFLTVKDNGTPGETPDPGNGLKGMQERAGERGGEASWEQHEDGFLVQIRLPVEAES